MSKRGRPTNQEVATLWDYRRGKLLLDVLGLYSINDDKELEAALRQLCEQWGVEVGLWYYDGYHFDPIETTHRLAKYVLEHGRNEADSE